MLEDKQALLGRHPYRFLSLELSAQGETQALPDHVERLVEARRGDTLDLKLRQGEDFIGEVIEGVRGAGYRIVDVHTREPSLENIFVELTMDKDEHPDNKVTA